MTIFVRVSTKTAREVKLEVPEKLRFYLDEMVPPAVANGLSRRGLDVLTTQEAGRIGTTDEQQLAFAVGESRKIFTMDIGVRLRD